MGASSFRRRTERRGLRLWPVGTVLALSFTAALIVAAAVFYLGWDLLGARGLKPEHRIDSQTLFDLVKLSFGMVAGSGALVALVVAYRRQRVDEEHALREATRLHTERFTTAVSQLGEDAAAVRLGGVHALVGLADDAPTRDLRQTCIDVLCAYLRLPYTAEDDLPDGDADARRAYLAAREVRHTVIRLIGNHLRLPDGHPHAWQGHDFDFTAVTFNGADFHDARFIGGQVSFAGARFTGGRVSFAGARFTGGHVDFHRARFIGGLVSFAGAQISGGQVSFSRAQFTGGAVGFDGALFVGGQVSFVDAQISGGAVGFDGALFIGGQVDFGEAHFIDGWVGFGSAQFTGGEVGFDGALFVGGQVSFVDAQFAGGQVDFLFARFTGGDVSFHRARFIGGRVDFRDATGMPPSGLVPRAGAPLPDGLHLPPQWHPNPS
ncbi:pentapeptide repeat-containing protein [Streptomyces melanogenes]|uniref:pentapeptide repeat-containing protein n=1 Tax=Streptomyces melanogenes TaxID=67326 RepID=UPI00167D843F|nr:pentapeptide repeat-containing protein [Streptomyces melanogenes]